MTDSFENSVEFRVLRQKAKDHRPELKAKVSFSFLSASILIIINAFLYQPSGSLG
jgi:hypothetical protein